MVGHIAEVGQIVACDFRQGNASPAKENLSFKARLKEDRCLCMYLGIGVVLTSAAIEN